MLKSVGFWLLILFFFVPVFAVNAEFARCNCDDEGLWGIESILECQKVSDFLIAVAYFSIPIELLYFVSCSNVPFKWVLFLFIAFIVLCGMTHLLNGWTYGPHAFQLMLSLTIFKGLTALVSVATAIALFTLLPLLLKVKVREFMLKKKAQDLGREVVIIKRQKETGLHVRMLTQEIRKSLDRHTILYTTLVELSKTLHLQNCAVWMPNENRTEMYLTHELNGSSPSNYNLSILTSDPDVREIKGSSGVKILEPNSPLAEVSSGGTAETGAVAAIRMPMLRASNFKGGTPEILQACYAILVLVLPSGFGRSWTAQEIEIVKVVADQVAVALSHAAVLEETQIMRDKLVNQNHALQQAKQEALMASQARNAFQKVMSNGLRRPMHSILGLLSFLQDENLSAKQKLIINTMVKTSSVLRNLVNDVIDTSIKDSGKFPLEMTSFEMHSMIREAACLSKCLCVSRGYTFSIEVDKFLPNHVMGDERRFVQVILHMVGNLLNGKNAGANLCFRVCSASGSRGMNDHGWGPWRPDSSDGYVYVRIEIQVSNSFSHDEESSSSNTQFPHQRYSSRGVEERLSFSMCKRLVQLMQGDIWVMPNTDGFHQTMALVVRFQIRPSIIVDISDQDQSSDPLSLYSHLKGLHVLVVDGDDGNRAVTSKLLQKLCCIVSAVSTGHECLSSIAPNTGAISTSYQIVLLDLQLPDLDGFDVVRRIRKFRSHNWPLIVGLAASNDDDDDIWEKCFNNGINGLIQKPFLLEGIADELQRVLLQANGF
ncbi:histidine kinase receptor of two-component system [Lithospermum erythrorhizon]|uniref:Ethylene receptor n=1 Tax=Lithospermum erythrorhizon TaxID=34254 RepID=A0AAV3RW10_LITER